MSKIHFLHLRENCACKKNGWRVKRTEEIHGEYNTASSLEAAEDDTEFEETEIIASSFYEFLDILMKGMIVV